MTNVFQFDPDNTDRRAALSLEKPPPVAIGRKCNLCRTTVAALAPSLYRLYKRQRENNACYFTVPMDTPTNPNPLPHCLVHCSNAIHRTGRVCEWANQYFNVKEE